MKRHRILGLDFDYRSNQLAIEISEHWSKEIKQNHLCNIELTKQELIKFYGFESTKSKLENFIQLGEKPMSIFAFHNKFFEQIRTSFIVGAYYPALTAACASGERILNHLILTLRNDYKSISLKKNSIYKNES